MRDMNSLLSIFLFAFSVMFIALTAGWVMLTMMGWEAAVFIVAGSLGFAGAAVVLATKAEKP